MALRAGTGDPAALAAVIRASQHDLWPVASWLAGIATAERLLPPAPLQRRTVGI
ncbi:hypothetical protein [Micromonospora sp. NPDC049301]|uniref:hypothetical protein n=1 Tax=Micromonospora sp. NPDC049301 TaxID=3155723 RepID=UPI0034310383